MLDPDDESTAEEIGALLARAHMVLSREAGTRAADATLRTAAERLRTARPGLPDYDAKRAVVHALRTAYPEHVAFALSPEPELASPGTPPGGLPVERLSHGDGWTADLAAFFAAAAAWPDAVAEAYFRGAFEAGWNRAGEHLPDRDWARRLRQEYADSPYGPPARPAWSS